MTLERTPRFDVEGRVVGTGDVAFPSPRIPVIRARKTDPRRALVSAATIAGAYIAGGLIPLAPYFIFSAAARALAVSVAFTLLALFVFGYVKGHFTGASPIRSAAQTTLVGGLAAAAAFAIARAIA